MLSAVEMSRLTMAGSHSELDEVLRLCANLGNVHITPYSGDTDGISVGTPHPDADGVSTLLAKVRAAKSVLNCANKDGPVSSKAVKQAISGNFSDKVDSISEIITKKNDAVAEITRLEERVSILETIAPLNIPLELMTEISSIDVYVGETPKANKAKQIFGELKDRIEMHIAGNVIAVACEGKEAAEVQMAMGELGAKSIQIPSGKGKPSKLLAGAVKDIEISNKIISECDSKMQTWVTNNQRMLIAVQEHLERESEILTGHTLCATSTHAYALEAWVPTSHADEARSVLSKVSSHLKIEKFVEDHGHGHDDHHEVEYPPVEYDTIAATRHASLLTNLVGRPKYGTIDPTSMIAFTFPIFYGLILGDAGYGLVIMMLAMFLKSKMGHDPVGAIGARILMNMGIATFVVGVLTAEAFGFIIEDWAPFASFYESLYNATHHTLTGTVFEELFGLSHTYLPFHRAGGALQDYILLSIYLGCAHLLLGFIIGFINVYRAHGPVAAFFEKGSWLLILIGGSAHILRFITDERYGTFQGSVWSIMVVVGVICLIYGLAVYEGFGWLGGIIMGPIETFGLLANTLSYLRVMAVGVAGVKIAEVGNEMGFHGMADALSSGDYLVAVFCLLIWIGVQVFALALGLLSPSIHAVRLHFVEWMGKFHDGSGQEFTPLGGRSLHVEGH
jgi:V/A-type H+/Na+-transporting ATPase subunit I